MTWLRIPFRAAVLGAALAPAALGAQGTTTVVAGERYRAGALHRWLLGSSYRDLWATPIAVPVLDLSTFAGGLTPTGTGGGNQTKSLRLRGGDGREYAFRSVDKVQTQTLPADLRGTLTSWAVQDQVSSFWPGASVAAHALEAAAGVPHTTERLFVMPDDPRLGEYRARFAGMLGTLEERPGTGRPLPPSWRALTGSRMATPSWCACARGPANGWTTASTWPCAWPTSSWATGTATPGSTCGPAFRAPAAATPGAPSRATATTPSSTTTGWR